MTKSALHDSNRGMLKRLIGATFISAITKAVWLIGLSTFVALMYTTPVYADSDASQNPCNSIDATSKYFGKHLHGIPETIKYEVLNAVVATMQGCVGERGDPNHIFPSTCAGGKSLV